MLDTTHLGPLAKRMNKCADRHRDILKVAGDAQHLAKQAIFSLHRKDMKTAQAKLDIAKKGLKTLQKKYNEQELLAEGAYRAGLEEYVEAFLLLQYVRGKKMGALDLNVTDDIYLAGLGDVPGELYRFAVRDATSGDAAQVESHASTASDIVQTLVAMDLTKYLRTKTDQAKQALHKLDHVRYELSLRS